MWKDGKVGDYVYRPFEILKPGKVIAVHPKPEPDYNERAELEIKWLDGTITTETNLFLHDFNHAAEEHFKKYQKFDAIRKTLQSL